MYLRTPSRVKRERIRILYRISTGIQAAHLHLFNTAYVHCLVAQPSTRAHAAPSPKVWGGCRALK
jgi:hypothetical protein